MDSPTDTLSKNRCFHCGDECIEDDISFDAKSFCCEGCKLVYQVLSENKLDTFYNLNTSPGTSGRTKQKVRYEFLEDSLISDKLVSYKDDTKTMVSFNLPQVHCSSCIWLLEHLYRVHPGILQSRVDFMRKEATVMFDHTKISLKEVAELLDRIGYPPKLSLENTASDKKKPKRDYSNFKIGIAFFCFGNIMMVSFPEYFGLDIQSREMFKEIFGILNILLALPVLLYADIEFLISAWKSVRARSLNIDVPISLGIIVMFFRSVVEIITDTGPGYMDSFTGLVFFLLVGRRFQHHTYKQLSFDRDFRSYFPIAVTTINDTGESSKALSELGKGDLIMIRNEELVPADSILVEGSAMIDYSFVTGENTPLKVDTGEMIYAGGRQKGLPITLKVDKKVSQSKLTQLWNDSQLKESQEQNMSVMVNNVSRFFTITVLLIATIVASYHFLADTGESVLDIFTAILIVTCPCALALSYPFTMGNSMRILSKWGFYVKNTIVIENLTRIKRIVFDKTGTVTQSGRSDVSYKGKQLDRQKKAWFYSLARSSNHPLSRIISDELSTDHQTSLSEFSEITGKGLTAVAEGRRIKMGSASFVGADTENESGTRIYLKTDEEIQGYFELQVKVRKDLHTTIQRLKGDYDLELLSGDNEGDRTRFAVLFPHQSYNRSPQEKLQHIQKLQEKGANVMMIGDGLNDAGALLQSDVGVAISDDTNAFTPASDVILFGAHFNKLPEYLRFSHWSVRVVIISYIFSLLYNVTGLYFASIGALTPLFAAILMPLSTVTIILIATAGSTIAGIQVLGRPGKKSVDAE
jgi:Cu+-exporting ATPase